MNSEPCKICGNTEMNLIDGFYYCVECGTQDANIMETLVENIMLKDGTFGIRRRTRITKFTQAVEKVNPEWHKWQAYNYILAGLVKEVTDLGAGPNFQMRVMWLWTLYVKKFQKKKELGLSEEDDEIIESTRCVSRVRKSLKLGFKDHLKFNIGKVNVNLFFTLIYVALNFDRSEILLSDLTRFIREGRVSSKNCIKYLPKELDVSVIKGFHLFNRTGSPNVEYINMQAMTVIKTLELGSPIVPDLRKIAERYIKELCLPEGFIDLVISLIDLVPCDYLDIDKFIMKQLCSVPFYDAKVMAYILVGLKMCFGLDDEYEIKLSDAVDHINNVNCHMKCYKLGEFSTSSDRLFSFRDWIKFLHLRRLILSRCYIPFANLYHLDVDDYTCLEQREAPIPFRKQSSLTDDIIMSIIDRMKTDAKIDVIPKNAFCHSLTPMTTYTQVVLKHHHDPDVRLLLSEDFTQYSLKYSYEDLDLRISDDSDNIVVGVDETTKCVKSKINSKVSAFLSSNRDCSLVYIRNCENKHWLKTNPPTINHFKKDNGENYIDENVIIDAVEHPIASETSSSSQTKTDDVNDDKKLEFINEDISENIYDDDFKNLVEYEEKRPPELIDVKEEPIDKENYEIRSTNGNILNTNFENQSLNFSVHSSIPDEDGLEYFFNPETFDREEAIKELVLLKCKKYKVPVPREYKTIETKEPRKRKAEPEEKENVVGVVTEEKLKKKRAKPGETRAQVDVLLSAYYDSLRHDVFSAVTHHLRDLVEDIERTREELNTDQVHGDLENNLNDSQNLNEDYAHLTDNNDTQVDSYNDTLVNENNDLQVSDPSLIEIQNQTVDDSVEEEAVNAYKGDPKFDDKVYDIKQLYVKVDEKNLEDVFSVEDDPEVEEILIKKINEISTTNDKADPKEESFRDWDDEEPLSDLKEQMEKKIMREDAFKNLEYLVANRKEITKNNYWVRHERILNRVQNRADSFTNEMKETFPSSFSFIIIECAAMLDCTPFILYKYMLEIEDILISRGQSVV